MIFFQKCKLGLFTVMLFSVLKYVLGLRDEMRDSVGFGFILACVFRSTVA